MKKVIIMSIVATMVLTSCGIGKEKPKEENHNAVAEQIGQEIVNHAENMIKATEAEQTTTEQPEVEQTENNAGENTGNQNVDNATTFSEPNANTPSASNPAQTPNNNAVKPSAPSKPNTAPSKPAPTPAKPAPSQPKPAPQAPKPQPPKPQQPAPQPPVHTHTWVHHPAVPEQGHNEPVKQIVTEPHIICGGCGKDFGTEKTAAEAALNHISAVFGDACENYSSKYVKVEKIVGNKWVVDVPGRPAYDQCSGCGVRR